VEYLVFLGLAPVAAIILALTALRIVRFRRIKVSRWILAYLLAVAALLLVNALELVSVGAEWTLRFAMLTHTAWHAVVVTWFVFAVLYTGYGRLVSVRFVAALSVYPAVMAVLLNSGLVTRFFWKEIVFFRVAGFLTMRGTYGPLFWINGAFIYALLLGGALLIVSVSVGRPGWYVRQSTSVLVGAILPILFNLIYVFRVFPWLRKDFTSLAFAISGIAFYYGVQNYRLLGKHPISRSTVLEDVRIAVLVVDADRTILDANHAARELFCRNGGCPETTSLGETILGGVDVRQHSSYETSVTDEEGRMRTFDVTIRPVVERTGNSHGSIVTIEETTEWVRLNHEVNTVHLQMLEQDRLATLGLLAANVAHEIKNPLTVLNSEYSYLQDRIAATAPEPVTAEELVRSREVFDRGVQRILSVIDTLTGQARPWDTEEYVDTDLNTLIRNTFTLTRSVHRGVARVEERLGAIPPVRCKAGAIGQVLLNVIMNAVDAIASICTGEGPGGNGSVGDGSPVEGDRVEGTIIVETGIAEDLPGAATVECRICNDGPPIPTEIRDRIFQPFFTTKRGGSGLGLAISREIIEGRHGGRIELVATADLTCFVIHLPATGSSVPGGAVAGGAAAAHGVVGTVTPGTVPPKSGPNVTDPRNGSPHG
jgi:signal transduction histidine kinase